LGLGAFITGELFNQIVGAATGAAALAAYPKFWWTCAGLALFVLLGFVALFRDDSNEPVTEPRGFEVTPPTSDAGTVHP
jgi:hypothetical protein